MANPRWYDDGVRIGLAVSESGDFVALGTRTEYPFTSTTGAAPTGWTAEVLNGGIVQDVNWTTANGRFSISNASTTNANTNKQYGIFRDFPIDYTKRFVFWVQTRTMDNKAGARYQVWYQFNGTGATYGFNNPTEQDWDQIAQYMVAGSGTTFLRVGLRVWYPGPPPGEVEQIGWGVQFQLPAMVQYENSYPAPVWHDVTCDVQSLQVAYGRSKYTGRFEVGTATIGVRNVDGEFTYQPVHPWGLRPGRFVKVTITDPKGTAYPTYYGLIDSINNGYPIDGKNTSVLNCIDVSSLLSNTTVPTESSATLSVLSGIRFRSLLDNAAWNPAMRVFDNGVYYQQGVLSNGRSVRDEMALGADSEGAYFWCDRSGIVTFRDRNYMKNTPRCNTVYAELLAECPDYLATVLFRFPGVIGNGMTFPYNAAMEGSWLTVEAELSFDDVSSGGRQSIAGQAGRWEFRKEGGGKRLGFTNAVGSVQSSADLPMTNGQTLWVRVGFNRSTLAVTFYTSDDGATWGQLGTTQTITGTMPTNTNAFQIGGNGATLLTPFKGILRNLRFGNGGTNWFVLRASEFPGQAGATTLNIASSGITVTVVQTGANVIVQDDTTVPPHNLPPVDNVPTDSNATVVLLKALETDWSRDRVINDVQIANQGGSAYQKVDAASQTKYGPRTYQRLDFLNDNAYPEYLVERTNDFMNGFTDSILRVNQVTFVPNEDTYAWVLGMWLLELVRVRYQHPIEGWGYGLATHIQGFVHTIDLNGWTTTLNLDQPLSFTYWLTPPGSIGWDEDLWDVGIWDDNDPDNTYWSSGQVWSDSQSKWS